MKPCWMLIQDTNAAARKYTTGTFVFTYKGYLCNFKMTLTF